MKFDIHKKEWEGLLYENGAGKKIVSHSKLKLWSFFWGHGDCESPLTTCTCNYFQYEGEPIVALSGHQM